MRSVAVFARKELVEIVKTWRIAVLPAILLLFAVTGPLLARYTPELVTALAGSQFSSLHLPAPTVVDAYGQWIKNLSQIALFALIIIYGGLVSSERRSGTAILVLSKPLSRFGFVVAKVVVHGLYLAVLLTVGTLITWGVSALVFGRAPGGPLWASAGVWLVLALFYLCVVTVLSVVITSAAGASGAGLGVFAVLSIGAIWKPLADYSPAGLTARATTLAAGTPTDPLLWPLVISLALCVGLVGLAGLLFRRQEI